MTHNSMSVTLPGWFRPQERPIGGQLEDGIRGLMIDTYYADKLPNGRIRTYFGSADAPAARWRRTGSARQSVESALRLRERLGFRGKGKRGMYMCHRLLRAGATPLADGLEDIHQFLVTHPAEVVVVINQDYVTPADFVEAVGDAGLTRYAFRPRPRALADAARDDRERPAAHAAGREPGGRGALVPARLRATDRGDAVHFGSAAQLTDPAAERRARATAGRPARRCS